MLVCGCGLSGTVTVVRLAFRTGSASTHSTRSTACRSRSRATSRGPPLRCLPFFRAEQGRCCQDRPKLRVRFPNSTRALPVVSGMSDKLKHLATDRYGARDAGALADHDLPPAPVAFSFPISLRRARILTQATLGLSALMSVMLLHTPEQRPRGSCPEQTGSTNRESRRGETRELRSRRVPSERNQWLVSCSSCSLDPPFKLSSTACDPVESLQAALPACKSTAAASATGALLLLPPLRFRRTRTLNSPGSQFA